MPKACKLYMWFRFACVCAHGHRCDSRPICGNICEFFKSLCIHVLTCVCRLVCVCWWGDEGIREGGTIFSPLCLSTVICISAAHHYLKVSINQSPLLFIVSPRTVRRLLNKKTFLYGEEGRREREKNATTRNIFIFRVLKRPLEAVFFFFCNALAGRCGSYQTRKLTHYLLPLFLLALCSPLRYSKVMASRSQYPQPRHTAQIGGLVRQLSRCGGRNRLISSEV